MQLPLTTFYKGLICLIGILLLIRCKNEEKPVQLLSEAEMSRVLMEVYINEEKISRLNLNRDSTEKIFELAKPYIFKRIGVSDSVFFESYNYYVAHPEELDKIYAVVVDSLNLREQKLIKGSAL
jgi:cAMP phosphodiesterase